MTWDLLEDMARRLPREKVREALAKLPGHAVEMLLAERADAVREGPPTPLAMAQHLYDDFAVRPHLEYLSERLEQAVKDVEGGKSRKIAIEMPPRSGKTTMATLSTPAWIMSRHPDWPIALVSHDGGLATGWGRQIRRWVDTGKLGNVRTARDAGAAGEWETTAGGKLLSISTRESFTGRGAKVLMIDDPHKDFVDAHSEKMRKNVWEWWLSVALTRLEPPSLVIVTMTRWHEDDFVGRLLSKEHEGDPDDWEVIRLPAIAEDDHDVIGRRTGQPLLTPLVTETAKQALKRWDEVKRSVGSYVWAAMYQQRPAPESGAIFHVGWWRFWTTVPENATDDGRIRLVDFREMQTGTWIDSWDMAFKATDSTDYVVGQRWVRWEGNRFLVDQARGRWSFTQTLAKVKAWAKTGWFPNRVRRRLVEDKANGPAIMDALRDAISGFKPVNPRGSKEARARAVTPEIESGNVYLPNPAEHPWVLELLSELRGFPTGAHDDQVDAMTQALDDLHDTGATTVGRPARSARRLTGSVTDAAKTTPNPLAPAVVPKVLPKQPGTRLGTRLGR